MPVEVDPTIEQSTAVSSAETASLKKKQILVAVLLVGLLIAILTQPKSDNGDTAAVLETKSAGQTADLAKPDEPVESEESRVDRLSQLRELDRIELSETSRFELFIPEVQRLQQRLGNLTHRVNAIYGDSNDRAALIGRSIVRRGQPLPEGGKVLHVNQDGIQVGR
jgi:hypothetical protein